MAMTNVSEFASESDKTILFHLGYEWWMMRGTKQLLKQHKLTQPCDLIYNSLLESLLVHARSILDFFYVFSEDETKNTKRNNANWTVDKLEGAWRREEIFDDNHELKKFRKEINKRIVHMTDERQTPLKDWSGLILAEDCISKKISCLDSAIAKHFDSEWLGNRPIDIPYLIMFTPGEKLNWGPSTTGPWGATGPTSS